MSIDRRDFLVIGSGLLAQASCRGNAIEHGAEEPKGGPAPAGVGSWQAVRELFDLDWSYIHLTGLLIASHPRPVRQAIEHHRREIDRNPVVYLHEHGGELEGAVHKAAAAFLGTDPARSEETRLNSSHLGISYAVFCLKK